MPRVAEPARAPCQLAEQLAQRERAPGALVTVAAPSSRRARVARALQDSTLREGNVTGREVVSGLDQGRE